MGYNVYLFKKEVKEKYPSDFEFMENEDLIDSFSSEQFDKLKTRLLRYGYQIENESDKLISFNFKGGEHGINATLSEKSLFISSGFSEDGVAEISLTASELTDSCDFAKLDLQDGNWEEAW